jgi:hypothetical protein
MAKPTRLKKGIIDYQNGYIDNKSQRNDETEIL